jgi:biotin carboxyl carrier protein
VHFELDIGGRARRLRVEMADGRYVVAVDDRVFQVDSRQVGRDTLSLLVQEGGGPARSVDAAITARPGTGVLEVLVNGHALTAALASRFGGRRGEGTAAGSGPQQLTAPMPGKVARVLVAAGDAVEARQGLVVVEAMKMENGLRSSRAGRVKAVRVSEGQSVEAGALLVIVE